MRGWTCPLAFLAPKSTKHNQHSAKSPPQSLVTLVCSVSLGDPLHIFHKITESTYTHTTVITHIADYTYWCSLKSTEMTPHGTVWFLRACLEQKEEKNIYNTVRTQAVWEAVWMCVRYCSSRKALILAHILRAGPSLMFMAVIKWSSLSRSNAWPSISWERNSSA